jgi:hypothetical protein
MTEWLKVGASLAVMAAVIWIGGIVLPVMGGSRLTCFISTGSLALVGAVIYGGMLIVLKTDFAETIIGLTKRVLSRKKNTKNTVVM